MATSNRLKIGSCNDSTPYETVYAFQHKPCGSLVTLGIDWRGQIWLACATCNELWQYFNNPIPENIVPSYKIEGEVESCPTRIVHSMVSSNPS